MTDNTGNGDSRARGASSDCGGSAPTIVCRGLGYRFLGPSGTKREEIAATRVLANVNLEIGQGQVVILTGASGSGKTTLMQLIGGLRAVQEGFLQVMGRTMNGLAPRQLLEVRRQIGYIFQNAELIASLTAAENVAMALRYQGLPAQKRWQRVEEVLSMLGLEMRQSYRPEALSGGQRQRVAIARALAHAPRLLLADEPTALLSQESARQVIETIRNLSRVQGCASLIVTHDQRILDAADSVITMSDGRIVAHRQLAATADAPQAIAAESATEMPQTPRAPAITPSAPKKIFICYRREESEDISARIYDNLIVEFGTDNVFLDIDAIPPGVNFREYLDQAVGQCDLLLAVIGEQWLDARYRKGPQQGQRRLDDAADFVRLEIASALARGIPVIPVLVGTAVMPGELDLPQGLRDLAYRQAAEVRSGRDFRQHVKRLIRDIQRLPIRQQRQES